MLQKSLHYHGILRKTGKNRLHNNILLILWHLKCLSFLCVLFYTLSFTLIYLIEASVM